jgi:hypothetical protein
MYRRSLTLAAFASSAFFLPIGDAAAPTTLKYKIVQRMEQTIDASAMGQGEQKVAMGYAAYLTVVVDDSASGRTVRGTVDSLIPDADAEPTIIAVLNRSKGATATAFIGPDGKLVNFAEKSADSTADASTALRGLLHSLFPAVKASAKVGESWTDTTATSDTANGMPTSRRSIVTYKATDGGSAAGQNTMKLDVSGTYSVGGANDAGVAFEGTGTQTGTFQRTSQGYLLDGTFNDNANMSFTVPQSPEPIPMSTVSAVTITLLR